MERHCRVSLFWSDECLDNDRVRRLIGDGRRTWALDRSCPDHETLSTRCRTDRADECALRMSGGEAALQNSASMFGRSTKSHAAYEYTEVGRSIRRYDLY